MWLLVNDKQRSQALNTERITYSWWVVSITGSLISFFNSERYGDEQPKKEDNMKKDFSRVFEKDE